VHEILTNEKYIGNNIFNRVSFKLKKKRVKNTPEMWVRKDEAFDPIVDPADFYTAQGMLLERHRRVSNEDLLAKLRALYERVGRLSGMIISESEETPSPTVYRHRFGSLVRAYELIGYTPDRDYTFVAINRRRTGTRACAPRWSRGTRRPREQRWRSSRRNYQGCGDPCRRTGRERAQRTLFTTGSPRRPTG